MDELKKRIIEDGIALGTEILKVDSFLNHQIDVKLFEAMGEEFADRFCGEEVDKIITVEASGIGVACIAAQYFDYPEVVFAKKVSPNTMTEEYYGAEVISFTKNEKSVIRIAKKYLKSKERILIIDDFLAHGQAAMGMAKLVEGAGAEVAGIGIVIEKAFQGGGKKLRDKGYNVESLAVVKSISDGNIEFE